MSDGATFKVKRVLDWELKVTVIPVLVWQRIKCKQVCCAAMDVYIPHVDSRLSRIPVKHRFTTLQLTIGGVVLACAAYIYIQRRSQYKQASATISATDNAPTVPNPTLSSPMGQTPAAISTNPL